MKEHHVTMSVLGPWSLATSRTFWEGFTPAALTAAPNREPATDAEPLTTVFCSEHDWSRAQASVSQQGDSAHITVSGDGDLDAAAAQVSRFLSLDVDARDWPAVGDRDPVIADAQQQLPGLRPWGFHSPYEAAVWAVLSQRVRMAAAARLRDDLVAQYGDDGAFPSPQRLRGLDLDLPGRKTEYLHAVADAALDGQLDGAALREIDPGEAISRVAQIKGLGPFSAELVVLRGAGAPDAVPTSERRLDSEISERYGDGVTLADVCEQWRPFRTWACVYLRSLRESRLASATSR